jgi:hypothetical protein
MLWRREICARYHVVAIPTWERKIRVLPVWLTALIFGRDIASLESAQHPRAAFVSGGEPQRESLISSRLAWRSAGDAGAWWFHVRVDRVARSRASWRTSRRCCSLFGCSCFGGICRRRALVARRWFRSRCFAHETLQARIC